MTNNSNGGVATYDGCDYSWSKGKLSTIYRALGGSSRAILPTLQSSQTYSFGYNGLGQRVSSGYNYVNISSSSLQMGELTAYSKKFSYDHSGRLIYETNTKTYYQEGSETYEIVYLYDDSGVVGMAYIKNGVTSAYYFQKNLMGDVVAVYDTNGAKIASYNYDAWGNCTIASNTTNYTIAHANPFRYRSYYYDEDTKLYYLKARYYSPEFRRFISPDDTNYLDPKNANGLNLYCYCGNDPINFVDPSGHFPWLILIAALILLTPVGGTITQAAVSTVGYGVAASLALGDLIFYEGNGAWGDMCSIGWNPFNSDENAVLNSNYVSFYKGVPVFRFKEGRSGSFGAIFLAEGQYDKSGNWVPTTADDLKHERGHNSQLMMMGIATYGFTVGIPSPLKLGIADPYYYDAPWEAMADILGGVTYRFNFKDTEQNAWDYYWRSLLFFPSVISYW